MILAVVAVFSLCVLSLCAVAAVFFVSGNDDNETAKSSGSVPGATAAPAPSRNGEQPTNEELPPFKKALPVIVTGSVYDAGEQTDLIQRENWPFAFRVPVGWLCDQAMVVEGSNNDGLECRPPGRTNNTAVRVGIRDCDEPCDRAAQEMLNADIGSGTLIEGDSTTSYAELANAKDNVYSLFVSHFFGTAAGKPIQWQVVIQGSSPHTDRAAIQKVANDIRTQTP